MTTHEVYAVKFAQHHRARRVDFYHGAGAEPVDSPVGIDYFVWLIRSPEADIVVDAGFTPEVARKRSRPDYYRSPSAALELLGVEPACVPYVVLTHLHYDHAGDLDPFTSARIVLQDQELRFWTGRHIHRRELLRHIETEDVLRLVRMSHAGRVLFVDGSRELVPGVTVHQLGGHTPGMQVVRVETGSGPIVLAGDATHLQDNIGGDAPASVFTDLPLVYEGFDRMVDLAGGDIERVIPGHEPTLLDRIPPVAGLDGIAGRIA
ncbi:N-acyl homoserine lactonase family protein [Saccharopolyspora sp. TS4A08]|uniref:N-acyl homoserine lactonase family protein n=1 Tax=Saccharopolyspora ipomoeae TaxID=3042027 RepID=A0ABT6PSD7_9PSEU|nr:N-acyl homoserine lactonase family protein [Saccharopolyspora sp. TS4A08]MDI2030563.1 N-acyl homoserine lactonase family protein [Saccharopolyspora sp. TS4A08]